MGIKNNYLLPTVIPPLKWAGGKRWLLHRESIFPDEFNSYFEPFLGSGAVFFRLAPKKGLISDINRELIDFYRAIKSRPDLVRRYMVRHAAGHSRDYYYAQRDARPRSSYSRAARTLYLNRTCWNGLYRVNQHGEFNVPIGTKDAVLTKTDDFDLLAGALKSINIGVCDFSLAVAKSQRGDFVFCDPPYTVKHNNNGFLKYNESIFTWADQVRLSESVKHADRRGAKILVTNAYHGSIIELYQGFKISKVDRASVISGATHGRGRYEECLITNY